MANTFLTSDLIAKEALVRLQNNLVMGNLVHRDFDNEFANVGDTIQVKVPNTFEAKDFTTEVEAQEIKESKVLVKLDKVADVTVEVSAKEMALNIQDFGQTIVQPAMEAIAQKIDAELCGLYSDIPYISGEAATTPAALSDIANVRKVLNENKVPLGNRRLVMDSEAEAKLIVLDAIAGADKSGTTQALREAEMGRILGFNTYADQNIKSHVKGTAATFNVAGTAGQSTLAVTTATNAHTFKKGDVISVTGVAQKFAVIEDVAVASTIATVKVSEPVKTTFTAAAGTLLGNHVASLGFHRNAFGLVTRNLALPMGGGANGSIMNYGGLSIRVTSGYAMASKINTLSFDILYGCRVLDPTLAVRFLG